MQALEGAKDTALRESDILSEQAKIEQKAAEEIALTQEGYGQELERQIEGGKKEVQASMDNMRAEYDKYKNMEIKDFWSSKSIGSKIASIIGITLGAYGQAKGGGPNIALALLDRAMSEDFNRQKLALDKQFKTMSLAEKDTDRARKFYEDSLDSLKLKQVAAIDKMNANLKAKMGTLGSEKAQLSGQKMIDNLELKKGQLQDEIMGKQNEKIRTLEQQSHELSKIRLTKGLDLEAQREGQAATLASQERAFGREQKGLAVPGFARDPNIVPTKTEAQKARKLAANSKRLQNRLNEYESLLADVGSAEFVGEKSNRMDTVRRELILELKEAKNLGVLQKIDLEQLEDLIPDHRSFKNVLRPSSLATDKVKYLKGLYIQDLNDSLSASGYVSEDKQAYDWAIKNPEAPQSSQILDGLRAKGFIR